MGIFSNSLFIFQVSKTISAKIMNISRPINDRGCESTRRGGGNGEKFHRLIIFINYLFIVYLVVFIFFGIKHNFSI